MKPTQRCRNCNRMILYTNTCIETFLIDLCDECSKSMSIITKALYIKRRNEEILEEDRNERLKERNSRVKKTFDKEEMLKDDIDFIINEKQDDILDILNKQLELINTANEKEVNPHAFSLKGICFFCKRHVEDLYKSNSYECE